MVEERQREERRGKGCVKKGRSKEERGDGRMCKRRQREEGIVELGASNIHS